MERFIVRQLVAQDLDKGFLDVLRQLTSVGNISRAAFEAQLERQRLHGNRIIVIEDSEKAKVVATGTLVLLPKFIHTCGLVGQIEDVVVDTAYRGRHLGQRIITHLMMLAEREGCYKVNLHCHQENVGFYEKCGLTAKEVVMEKRFGG